LLGAYPASLRDKFCLWLRHANRPEYDVCVFFLIFLYFSST
jgi:hypothetical protein